MKKLIAIALGAALVLGASTPAFAEDNPNGWSIEPTYTKALNILSAQGYSQVSSLSRKGQTVEAQVQKDGKPVTVTVDVQRGTVDVRG